MATTELLPLLLLPAALAVLLGVEALARRHGQARLRREIEALREAARRDRAALEALEAELAALRPPSAAPPPKDERRMMKGLVAKLRARREQQEGTAAPTAVAASEAPAPDHRRPAEAADTPFPDAPSSDEPFPDEPFPEQAATRQASPGQAFDEATLLQAVREALTHDYVELVLQPVVSLPQRRRRFYECTTRIRDGEERIVAAADYIPVAERAGLVAAIDNILLFRCIQLVRSLQRRHEALDFFCNVSADSLRDEAFFADFVDYLAQQPEPAAHLIFELSHAAFDAQGPRARGLLERLRALGCRLSVDGAEPSRLDPEALAARGVGFVKLEAARLLAFSLQQGPAAAADLVRRIAEAGLVAIVEKVEDEESLRELLDFGIDFGQGHLFGEPRPARKAA